MSEETKKDVCHVCGNTQIAKLIIAGKVTINDKVVKDMAEFISAKKGDLVKIGSTMEYTVQR